MTTGLTVTCSAAFEINVISLSSEDMNQKRIEFQQNCPVSETSFFSVIGISGIGCLIEKSKDTNVNLKL